MDQFPAEYMGKFKWIIKDPEGNIRKLWGLYDSPLTHERLKILVMEETLFLYADSIVSYYLKRKTACTGDKICSFYSRRDLDVPGIKYDKTVYTVNAIMVAIFAGRYSYDLDTLRLTETIHMTILRITFNPDESGITQVTEMDLYVI